MKFCPICHYYLYLNYIDKSYKEGQETPIVTPLEKLNRVCKNCGYREEDNTGGLILETDLQEKTSEGYKILINEFTNLDPTLPHVDTIKCPNTSCKSNVSNAQKDVIYMKYDSVNMKYLYICNVCNTHWKSKSN
jgi:hypothetical protein